MKASSMLEPKSYTWKIVIFYILMIGDIYISYHMLFIDFDDSVRDNQNVNKDDRDDEQDKVGGFFLNGLQALIQIAMFFWFFFLIWKTFLFRYTLMKALCKEFVFFFILLPINFSVFFVERMLRLVRYHRYNK